MKRLLMLIVSMVLLSGAAWGEYASVKELRAAWFLNDCESGTSTFRILNIPDPKNPNCTFETSGVTTFGSVPDGWTPFMEMNYFLVIGRRVCKFGAPDPTAWKLTDSKYGAEEIDKQGNVTFTRSKDRCWTIMERNGIYTIRYNGNCRQPDENMTIVIDTRQSLEAD